MTGRMRAYVVAPSGIQSDALVHQVDVDQHAVRFTPHENGAHLVHVLMDERPVPGSPFRVLVGQEETGHVTASGEGLTHGRVGMLNIFTYQELILTKDTVVKNLFLLERFFLQPLNLSSFY